MQDIAKPGYLQTITDPSFGTTIRRISDAGNGGVIKPVYSTVQAWNADESLMILYDQRNGVHQLLDGITYTFIRNLSDVRPTDLEDLFWDFNDPDILWYIDDSTSELMRYSMSGQSAESEADLRTLSGCGGGVTPGNDVQMMSWNSDKIGFRCGSTGAHIYQISTGQLTSLDLEHNGWVAPNMAPSGNLYLHARSVYDTDGNFLRDIPTSGNEHSTMGRLSNGNDAMFSITFSSQYGCLADIIAVDLTDGTCFEITGEANGYDYPKSGTHVSGLAHKNSNPGWVSASMVGYEEDGQTLLDQEIIVANSDPNDLKVVRVAHHRSDENEFDYWGEPHASLSPTGTRVLFGSDWSGSEDGQSVDSYVVELPSYEQISLSIELITLEARSTSEGIMLTWSTASETDNQGFEIEVKSEGTAWQLVGYVEGHGTTTSQTDYEFAYAEPLPGVNQLRLKQIDFDGTYNYSQVVEVSSDGAVGPEMVQLYPNPTSSNAQVRMRVGASQQVAVNLYDVAGRKVLDVYSGMMNADASRVFSVHLAELPAGVYTLSVVGETFNESRPIVVTR